MAGAVPSVAGIRAAQTGGTQQRLNRFLTRPETRLPPVESDESQDSPLIPGSTADSALRQEPVYERLSTED